MRCGTPTAARKTSRLRIGLHRIGLALELTRPRHAIMLPDDAEVNDGEPAGTSAGYRSGLCLSLCLERPLSFACRVVTWAFPRFCGGPSTSAVNRTLAFLGLE